MKIKHCIFCFGGNEVGRHGKGAALTALNLFGARYGVGVGFCGNSYSIPTKDQCLHVLPLDKISKYVRGFLYFAYRNPGRSFLVTRIGCGLAGYSDEQIAPLFKNATSNCILPAIWNIDNGNIGHHLESITKDDLEKEVW